MASLPADRTKLALAQGNQVPNLVLASAKNINAIIEVYDTVDLLNQKVDLNYGTGAIGTNQLATDSVTLAKMADSSVGTTELVAASVTLAKMAAASVGTTQLVDGSVTDAKIAPSTITADKFVAGALNNDTQNGLLITALTADVVQRGVNVCSAPYNADNTGVNDSSAAIQAALDTGYNVYIPRGIYKILTALKLKTFGQIIEGAGMELTTLTLSGAINGFETDSSVTLQRVIMRDFGISGVTSTGKGIYLTGQVYESSFENLLIYTGSEAINLPSEFSTRFVGIQASSHDSNAFLVQGGNSTTFISCYVHNVPTGKVGYKVYGGAAFIGCNGVDSGDYWGEFGSTVADEGINTLYNVTMINCNVEDFKKVGVHFKYDGSALIEDCSFAPPAVVTSATYDTCISIDLCGKLVKLTNVKLTPKGATRNKLADIYSSSSASVISEGSNSFITMDKANVLNTIPNITSFTNKFATYSYRVNNLYMDRGYGFYLPDYATWTANTASFSVASIDRLETANTIATGLTNATGGVRGQTLSILIADANTTLKHQIGGAGRFWLKTGADIVATLHQVYKFQYDGTNWCQV